MPFVIGIDEAGYGPNLGPLVISATAWRVPREPWDVDLYALLADGVCARPDGTRTWIADSKQIYQPSRGLELLEQGVLAALHLVERPCADWRGIWDALRADELEQRLALPWYAGYNGPLPTSGALAAIEPLARKLNDACQAANVRLVDVRSRAVFPQELNALVDDLGSKGAALSRITVQLLAGVLRELPPEPTLVTCDKHGGRNRYQAILQRQFPDVLVEVHREDRRQSVYCWGPPERRREVRFCAGGEEFLPTALASMTSKYLRELAMAAFNDYWCTLVPNLRRTAGYPVDARRFRRDIADYQIRLKIDDVAIWRSR
jgi:ribonuclease HII